VTSPITSFILRQKLPCTGPPLALPAVSWLNPEFLTKRQWCKRFPTSNDVILVITYLQNCEIGPWLMNTDRPICYVERKIGPLFSVCCLKHWSWMRVERANNLVSGSGVVRGCEQNWLQWQQSRIGRSLSAEWSGSHRNRFERRAEILPLPLRWHALFITSIRKAWDTLLHWQFIFRSHAQWRHVSELQHLIRL